MSLSRERDIADIVRYQAQRLSDGVTKRTINHELQVLRMAINLAYENGHLREQPIRKWRFVLGADSPRTRVLRPGPRSPRRWRYLERYARSVLIKIALHLLSLVRLRGDRPPAKGHILPTRDEDFRAPHTGMHARSTMGRRYRGV